MTTWRTKTDSRLAGTEPTIGPETYVVGEDITGFVLLNEVPKQDAPSSVEVTRGATTLTEVTTPPGVDEYRVYYTGRLGGAIEFNAGDEGQTVSVTYKGRGSNVFARDLNRLQVEKVDRDGSIALTGALNAAFGMSVGGTVVLTAARELQNVTMDASLLTGTVADARLSSNIPRKNAANVFSIYQQFSVGSSTLPIWQAAVSGDAENRFVADISGKMEWGDGTAVRDVSLYRSAVATLKTSGAFDAAALKIGDVAVISTGRILQNVVTDTSILTSGTLGVARGGTGLSSVGQGSLLYASAGDVWAALAGPVTDGWVVTWNSTTGLPEWRAPSGGGGSLGGGGTAGKLAKWTSTAALGDSILSESGGVVTVGGASTFEGKVTVNTGGLQVNSGDITLASGAGRLLLTVRHAPAINASASGVDISGTLVEAASGNHPRLSLLALSAPTVTAGAATVADAQTLYIAGAPSATVTGKNRAVWVASGLVEFGGDLVVGGNITASGDVTAFSDVRLKQNIETITDALTLVQRMRGVRFERIDSGQRRVGVIAQEMLSVLPEVVFGGGAEYYSVGYDSLTAVLIEAVKELSARVAELEGR